MSKYPDPVDMQLFANVASEKSFTKGAERSYLSLPAASNRIRQLEQNFGVTLFNRTTRGVSLTSAGETLLHHANTILLQLNAMEADISAHLHQLKGKISIYANTTAISKSLSLVLANYLMAHPDVTVDLHEQSSDEGVRAVEEGQADIAVVAENDVSLGLLSVTPFGTENLVLVTSAEHMLARRTQVEFEETLAYGYVVPQNKASLFLFLSHQAQELRKKIIARARVSNFETVCQMVEANAGVAVLPESTGARFTRSMDIRIVPLTDAWATRRLVVCARDYELLPVFAQNLVAMIRSHVRNRTSTLAHDSTERHIEV